MLARCQVLDRHKQVPPIQRDRVAYYRMLGKVRPPYRNLANDDLLLSKHRH